MGFSVTFVKKAVKLCIFIIIFRSTLRDYTKIEAQNCQLVTQYGRKVFKWPHDVTTTTNDDIVIVDSTNKDIVIMDKDMKLISTFGQGSGDSELIYPVGVAVGHNVVAVSEVW